MMILQTSKSRGSSMTHEIPQNALNSAYIERSFERRLNIALPQLSLTQKRLNKWNDFCNNYNIFPRYRDASIDNLTIPPNKDGEPFSEKAVRWVDSRKSLILQGKAGRGKTHFMFALVREMFLQGLQLRDIKYFDHVDLDRRLQEAIYQYKSSRGLIEQLCDCDVLILDDFGIDTGAHRHERDFYEVFNKRFGRNYITIISTNLDDKELYKAYGERIASRFKEAAVIEFNGPDLRG